MTTPMKIKLSELENFSKQELILLANNATKLQEALKSKRQEHYLKNAHVGQTAFHKDKHRIRLLLAGNRSGKSTCGINEFAWLNIGTHPYKKCKVPIKSAIVLQDFENHCKNVIEPKVKEWIAPNDIKKIERNQSQAIKRILWKSGSITDVYSHDQSLKVFEGSDYDLVWFDEPPPRKIWTALWRGCTDRGGSMFLTGTPLASPWLYHEYQRVKDGSDSLTSATVFDTFVNAKNIGEGNESLGKQRIEDMASQYTADERHARLHGGFVEVQGLIFKNWSQGIHMLDEFEIPHDWPIWESIDPHPHKPWAVVYIAIAPNGTKVLLRSVYVEGVIDEVANQILLLRSQSLPIVHGLQPKIVRTIIDNASSVPMWQRSFQDPTAKRVSVREELESLIGPKCGGPRIEVAPKNVAGKIDVLKRWLHVRERNGKQRADFYVFKNEDSDNFVKEIESYIWDRFRRSDGDELKIKPVKKNDDLIDAVMQVALILGDRDISKEPDIIKWTQGLETYGIKGESTSGRDKARRILI